MVSQLVSLPPLEQCDDDDSFYLVTDTNQLGRYDNPSTLKSRKIRIRPEAVAEPLSRKTVVRGDSSRAGSLPRHPYTFGNQDSFDHCDWARGRPKVI